MITHLSRRAQRGHFQLKRLSARLCLGALSLSMFAQIASAELNPKDPRSIMDAVSNRADGDKSKSRLVMTIIDKDGRKRERIVQSYSLDFKEGTKQVMYFESPADIRGTGLLSVDYESGDRDDDQWLYLPSLHKSTRISSGDKSGSFMGTDLSYADMTESDPDHYEYKMLKESAKVKLDGQAEECWLIESRPKTKKAKDETGYVRSIVWVSKAKLMPVQLMAEIRKGKKTKYIQFKNIKQVDGLWTAHTIVARTTRGKSVESTTILQFSEMSYNNADVNESLFQLTKLESGF